MTPSNPASGTNEAPIYDERICGYCGKDLSHDCPSDWRRAERAIGGPRDLSVLDFIGTLRWIADNGGIPAEGSEREARLVELWEHRLRLPATERAIGAALDAQTTDLLVALAERNVHSRGDLEVLLDG